MSKLPSNKKSETKEPQKNKYKTMLQNIHSKKNSLKITEKFNKMNEYTGLVDLSCITMKTCKEVIEKIKSILNNIRIEYYNTDSFIFRCQKNELKFEVEITTWNGLYYIKMQRLSQDKITYRKIISMILERMNP